MQGLLCCMLKMYCISYFKVVFIDDLKTLQLCCYETKQNDGGTPYYLPRIMDLSYNYTFENGFEKAQRQKVMAVIL